MLIGLTGQIGAGKSSVARALSRLGAVVIDADVVGKAVVNLYPPLQARLAAAFGDDVLEQGVLNRRRLAARAFRDETSKQQLDTIVHPFLLKELRGRVARARRFGVPVVIDAALLNQWKLDRECDLVIAVLAREELRVRRLLSRGLDREDIAARMKLQTPVTQLRRTADIVIANNGSLKGLEARVTKVWKETMAQIEHSITHGGARPKK